MKRYIPVVLISLFAAPLVSCGGGGGSSTAVTTPGPTGGAPAFPTAGMRVEETDAAVTSSGAWTKSDSSMGWSGGSAMQSATPNATVSVTFIGTSVRWIGSRGRGMGIALVSVDAGPSKEVDLFARP